MRSLARGMLHAACMCRHCPKQLMPLFTAAQLGLATLHEYMFSAMWVWVHRKLALASGFAYTKRGGFSHHVLELLPCG